MTTLLSLTFVSKSFGAVQALRDVSFDLQAGEVHALVGENGAGKSTLIKIVTGAHRADSGRLEIDGRVVDDNDPLRAKSLGVAAIYQQPALFPDLSVAENLALGLERGCVVSWRERRRKARELLDRVGAKIDPEAPAGRLSMPEQQLVEIARALGAQAKILILDEPTASLAERETRALFGVIRELRGQGVGMVYISHRLEELFEVADRVTVLRDGATVATCRLTEVDRDELIQLMVGRELSTIYPKRSVPIGDTVLEIGDLSVRSGEIVGLAGLVGAGRTELAESVFGLRGATKVKLRGADVEVDSPRRAVDLGIAYVPEDRRRHGVILDLPVAANTTLATLREIFLDLGREEETAARYVKELDIRTPSVCTPVGNLSGGNQQKVALARWLETSPKVLILDEPTQGIDVGAKSEIHRLMVDLAERGLAILLISSEMPEVLGMSDRIAVMAGGRIKAVLPRAEATQEKILELALSHG